MKSAFIFIAFICGLYKKSGHRSCLMLICTGRDLSKKERSIYEQINP